MSNPKHTPGPWELDQDEQPFVYPAVGGRMIAACNMQQRGMEENVANARLIAAAPELLAAAKRILHHDEHCGAGDCDQWAEVIAQLRAAVLKGEGGPDAAE